jgi:hypothetical protein
MKNKIKLRCPGSKIRSKGKGKGLGYGKGKGPLGVPKESLGLNRRNKFRKISIRR